MNKIIYTPTKDKYIKVVQKLLDMGYIWISGDKEVCESQWEFYKEETCVSVLEENNNRIAYASKGYFQQECPNIPIISANEFLGDMPPYSTFEYYHKLYQTPEPEQHKGEGKTMNLNTMMKKLLDKNTQKLVKAGYINGDLELTREGNEALTAILFEQNKEELVKLAEEKLKEEI